MAGGVRGRARRHGFGAVYFEGGLVTLEAWGPAGRPTVSAGGDRAPGSGGAASPRCPGGVSGVGSSCGSSAGWRRSRRQKPRPTMALRSKPRPRAHVRLRLESRPKWLKLSLSPKLNPRLRVRLIPRPKLMVAGQASPHTRMGGAGDEGGRGELGRRGEGWLGLQGFPFESLVWGGSVRSGQPD